MFFSEEKNQKTFTSFAHYRMGERRATYYFACFKA
jgi:hypothetical protein